MISEIGAGTEPSQERREPAPVSRGFIALYVLALLGTYLAVMTPLLVSLAVHLEQIDVAERPEFAEFVEAGMSAVEPKTKVRDALGLIPDAEPILRGVAAALTGL